MLERFKNNETDVDTKELFEDLKALETEAPEIADIMKRMIAAEVEAIKKEKEGQLGAASL